MSPKPPDDLGSPLSLRLPPRLRAKLDLVLKALQADPKLAPEIARNRHALILACVERGLAEVVKALPPAEQQRLQQATGAQLAADIMAKVRARAQAAPRRRARGSGDNDILAGLVAAGVLAAIATKAKR